MAGLLKNNKSGLHNWGREGSTQFSQKFVTAVTAPPLVSCVVWSHDNSLNTSITNVAKKTAYNFIFKQKNNINKSDSSLFD